MRAVFKPFEIADTDVLLSMMEDFYLMDKYPFSTEVSKKLFLQFIADTNLGRGWTILLNGKVTGYFILTFVFSFEYKGRIAFLDELYITEAARGKGLGGQALIFMQEQAKLSDVKIIYLEVENHNEAAQKLYLSNKFKVHKRGIMKMVIT